MYREEVVIKNKKMLVNIYKKPELLRPISNVKELIAFVEKI